MVFHYRAGEIQLVVRSKFFYSFKRHEAFVAKLAYEAWLYAEVCLEALTLMPHAPEVHVTFAGVVPVVAECFRTCARRAWPPRTFRITALYHFLNGAVVETIIIYNVTVPAVA